ncbi:MAG: NUDIX hydrolase, partial [Candidatus Parcubacteria bacterium]|nr:NUDIX hydrolase [Candidatus Parcubacteria bacterium]
MKENTTIFGFVVAPSPNPEIALVQTIDHRGQWSLPGGSMDEQDLDDVEALVRELGEEIGISIHRPEVVLDRSNLIYYEPPQGDHRVVALLVEPLWPAALTPQDHEEITTARWFTVAEVR